MVKIKYREIDLFDFTSFFRLDFLNFLAHCVKYRYLPKSISKCLLIFQHLSESTVKLFHLSTQDKPPELLKDITKPLTKSIIQIDKKVLKGWTLNNAEFDCVDTLLQKKCLIEESKLSSPING